MGEVVLVFAVFVFAFLFGWLANGKIRRGKQENAQAQTAALIEEAKAEAEDLKKTALLEAREQWRRQQEPLEREQEGAKRELREQEAKLQEHEQQLDRKVDVLASKERTLVKQEQEQERREEHTAAAEKEAEALVLQQRQKLEHLAGLSQAEARRALILQQEENARQFAARKVKEIKDHAIANANREAREIIVRSVQRFAVDLAVESTISVVHLPTDEMKGRIIGRDGRNIRSFELITGIEVIVDDTPGMVMLSGFDPLRREIGKNTLEKLILDGRIHPGRIEEVYEKACQDVAEMIRESGSKAAFDLGLHDLAEPLLELLGKLRFRTSYGQNLLTHSKEVGYLAGMMAEELQLDVALARRAGLLHDIGKALDNEVGSDPAQTSAALARKCGESAEVVNVIETHHQSLPARSLIAALVDAANDISTGRPGARKEKVEEYIQRLKHVEAIALSYPGVTKAYALQSSKEVRVLVDSTVVDDAYADQLADEITDRLEEELDQIGQLKVCLIREVRAIHYAR